MKSNMKFEIKEWERILNEFKRDFPVLFRQGQCLTCTLKGTGCGADCKDYRNAHEVYSKAWSVFLELNPYISKTGGIEHSISPKIGFLREVNNLTRRITRQRS